MFSDDELLFIHTILDNAENVRGTKSKKTLVEIMIKIENLGQAKAAMNMMGKKAGGELTEQPAAKKGDPKKAKNK